MAFFQNAITQLSVLGVPMYAGITTTSIQSSPLSLVISVNAPTIIGKANVSVDPSTIVISVNAVTVITGNTSLVDPLVLKISTNTPTIVGKANVSVNQRNLTIGLYAPQIFTGRVVSVDPLVIKISTNTPTIVGKANVPVNPSTIVISTNTPTIVGKANVPVSEITIVINTNDPIIHLGKNIFPDAFVINISVNPVTVVGKANVSVNPITIVISTNNPTIVGNANVPVDQSIIVISINAPTIIGKANVLADPLVVLISIKDPTIEIRFPETVIVTSLNLYVSLIAPTFTTEISEYDQYPACPRDIFGDWFQEDRQVYDREKEMLAMLHMEAFNMFGVPMFYYAASYNTSANKIFGEDNNRRFTQVFDIMSFYHLPREDKLWSKFGIEGIDEITMYISKEHFQYVTSSTGGYSYIPKTGDIIKAKYNNYYYEIVAIKEEASQFLQSKRYVWELIVRPFKDAHIINMISGDPIGTVTNKTTDLFDRVQAINAKMSGIAYQNKPCEKPANDPFALWR